MSDSKSTKILIVDDESPARKRIIDLLKKFEGNLQIEEAKDGIMAIEKIKSWNPNIVFLDIQMPGLTGFDILDEIEDVNFSVVFQTAYDEFAMKAFEVSACDYLLKPYSDERFYKALNKAISNQPGKELDSLFNHLRENDRYMENLSFKVGNHMRIIEVASIRYFFSKEHVTSLYIEDTNYAIDHSLSFLEEKLNPAMFIRIHRNAIVNLNNIKGYTKGTSMVVTMDDGEELKVSRDRRKVVLELLSTRVL